MSKTMELINQCGIVPVVVIDDASHAIDTAKALLEGGVGVMEITMRTPAGLESIRLVSEECPDMLVGAGTVLTLDQCKRAIDNGAKFIVSPGFDEEIVDYCISSNIPICPGCVTPTEITTAMKKGLKVLKFFPANLYGGLKALKALAGPFGDITFIPTGGASLNNLLDFINPTVFAIGGSWLCTRQDINNCNFEGITKMCIQSIDVLLGLKDKKENDISLKDVLSNGGTVTTINEVKLGYQLKLRGFLATEENLYSKDGIEITIEQ